MKKNKIEILLKRKIFKDLGDIKLTNYQINELNKLLEVYNSKTIKNRLKNIYIFIKYNVNGSWLERINIIRTKLKNDVGSLYSLQVRYGDEIGNIKYKKRCESCKRNEKFFIEKYGNNLGLVKWGEYKIKSKTPWGLSSCINRFGFKLGTEKWDERLNKKIKTMADRKKNKPYKNGRTLKEYQNRYGLDRGLLLWEKRNDKQKYRFSKKYYIDNFGVIEGEIQWGNFRLTMNKTSLNSFIERYGEIKGIERFESFIKVIKYKSSLEYYIEKYGEENGKIKYEELLLKKIFHYPGYSKISQKLFWGIYDEISSEIKDNIYFAELNKEFILFIHQPWGKLISLDFKYKNKIIEFDGDYWHSKPKQIIKDKLRDDYLIKCNYKILRVKEMDYKNNPKNVITKCVNFLKK